MLKIIKSLLMVSLVPRLHPPAFNRKVEAGGWSLGTRLTDGNTCVRNCMIVTLMSINGFFLVSMCMLMLSVRCNSN